VTNELNISGGVAYYTIPTENVTSCTTVLDFTSGGTNYPSIRTVQVTRTPPPTLAQAMSIPGSLSRKAKEGAYIQFRASKGQPNPPIEPMRNTRVFLGKSAIQATNGNSIGGYACAPSAWNTIAAFTPVPNLPYSQAVPFDISGAYFNGMSASTALNITLRLYIEVFPTAANQTLVSLTQPCPCDDPIAYELYSCVGRNLPPGCEVKYNDNGGWFKGLMKTIASVAPTVGSALGTIIPGGGLIGKAAGGLAEMLGGMKLGEKQQKEVDDRRKKVEDRMESWSSGQVERSDKLRARKKENRSKKTAKEVVVVEEVPRGRATSRSGLSRVRARSRSRPR